MLRSFTPTNKNIILKQPRVICRSAKLGTDQLGTDKANCRRSLECSGFFVLLLFLALLVLPSVVKAQSNGFSRAGSKETLFLNPLTIPAQDNVAPQDSLAGALPEQDSDSISESNIPIPTSLAPTSRQMLRERLQRQSHHPIFFGDGPQSQAQDSIDKMIELFYVDQFRAFQDPMAPYFLFMSKDNRLAMGVGGAVRMRAWMDLAGEVPESGFAPYLIPVPKDPTLRRRFSGTPGGTALFLKVIGRNVMGYTVMAYIQGGFNSGSSYGFKLKKAYFSVNDWTVGYATTTFSDNDAQAPFIDGGGSNGDASTTTMLVRWSHTSLKNHLTYALSLEVPKSQYKADGTSVAHLDSWLPDVAGFIQADLGHKQHVRLAGIATTLPYRNLVQKKNSNVIGWAAQLSTILRPMGDLNIFGTLNYGRGYACRNGDLKIGSYDLVPSLTQGKMVAPKIGSVSFGAQYFFTEHIFASASVGQVRYFSLSNVSPTDYKYGRYVNATLFYEPTARLQVGVEFVGGQRVNVNGERASAHRAEMLFQFSF